MKNIAIVITSMILTSVFIYWFAYHWPFDVGYINNYVYYFLVSYFEETIKLIVWYVVSRLFRIKFLDALMISCFSFAWIETIMYSYDEWIGIYIGRVIWSFPIHMSLYFLVREFGRQWFSMQILLHTTYNLCLTYEFYVVAILSPIMYVFSDTVRGEKEDSNTQMYNELKYYYK